jgi:transposase
MSCSPAWLHSDGYEVYGALAGASADIRLIRCFAHARRKFDEALKGQGRTARGATAQMGLAYIQKLYGLERQLKDLTRQERTRARQRQARPILDAIHAWVLWSLPEVPPSTLTGKVLVCLHHQWPCLIGYLDDGRLAIDDNACERAICSSLIGRRNWLFANTTKEARVSATHCSLIKTAKANGHEPFRYLRLLFSELPKTSPDQIATLLPTTLAPEDVPAA